MKCKPSCFCSSTKGIIIMQCIQSFKLAAIAFVLTISASAFAGEAKPYSAEALKTAQANGESVLVEFHAPWCTTCKKQKPVIESLLKEEKAFGKVVALTADYDKEVDLKKQLGVTKQSTLVVFKGNKEVGRAMGLTDRAAIKELITKGI